MSSLGLPGPSNMPPGNAALHRSWNQFLDYHNLRVVFQTSLNQIDEQCADAIEALRASSQRREEVRDAILRLWDSTGLAADCLPSDVNPHWRAEEQLLKPTALRLAARRARLAEKKAEEERLDGSLWDPMSFTLDMFAPTKRESSKEKGKGKRERKSEGTETTLEVITSLANTDYFVGHVPGDPIFSYDPQPPFRPADERNFTYRGRVPRDPGEDMLRLQLLLPRVLAQLVVLIAFFPENPSVVPVECIKMLDEVDGLGDEVFRTIRHFWKAKYASMSAAEAALYMHFLRSSPLMQELVWLIHGVCLDDTRHRSPQEKRRARHLWTKMLPVVQVLTSDKMAGWSACEALLRIVELHVKDQDRRARDMVFKEGEYSRALVYREGVVINKSIHAFYASHTNRLRYNIAGALFRTNPHPLLPADPAPDDFDTDPVPIPDEVLAAFESIRARHELPPGADTSSRPALPEPSRTEKSFVVAGRQKRRPEDKDTCAAAAAAQEPRRKRPRR
ncbi:hypothetical protein LZ32DRAFT_668455 [Colletotrichum eremochloae]|nr:hypothetical protein LZ32DRAFT_668455 [Colletotrichum eremochloae]